MENSEKKSGKGSSPNSRKNLTPWKKGQKVKGAGHPKGQRNFITIYRAAIKVLAKKIDLSAEDLENEIVMKGLIEARSGNYPYYKDLQDRVHGQAVKPVTIGGDLNLKVGKLEEIQKATKSILGKK